MGNYQDHRDSPLETKDLCGETMLSEASLNLGPKFRRSLRKRRKFVHALYINMMVLTKQNKTKKTTTKSQPLATLSPLFPQCPVP
ncbi:hypothetical protein CHS0354_034941 [Potamilus streckersoni]|uniref:Uncharacterized protein n=1 Tax=Potamilus streckersoni TaxID=2493646 RepID=A0AAE0SDZ1_9BIVA|nr:hypothetical protein CHS0354_034941 [Potamilus streckersoni]